MADYNDGSIIIDTELDSDGFEKGSSKLLDAVKDLTNSIDNMGDNIMRSFEQIAPVLSSIAGSASQLTGMMKSEATRVVEANDEIVSSEQRVASSAQQAASAISTSTGNAQTSTSGLERQINSINSSLESVSRSAETGFSNGSAVLSFNSKLDTLEGRLDAVRTQLEDFGNTKIPTAEYTELTQCIAKASKELEQLRERQVTMEDTGVKKNSKAWKTLEYNIQAVQRVLESYKIDLASLESSGDAFVMGSDTDEYSQMTQAVNDTADAIERNRALIDSEALAQARLNVQAAQEQVIRAETASQREAALESLTSAQQNLNELASSMSSNGNSAPSESDISAWQRFGSVVKTAGSAALKAAGNIAKIGAQTAAKAAASGIQYLTNKLKSFISSSKSASSSANILTKTLTSLKTMLKSRIKRMFISSIISNIKEGLKDLASYDSTFNTSMSNIKNGAKELTANLSVTLGRLIQVIEPFLTTIINAASKAVSYFNALLSMLGGGSTVVTAKKQMASYADSTKDAASATEDLKNQVYGFDKLNKRSDSSSSSSSSGSNLYETQNVDDLLPDGVTSFFDRIKAAITSGDWEGLGSAIADGFNTAFTVVDNWINNTFRPLAVKWTKNIAETLNGFIKNLNWTQIGKTLSDGINTVFEVVNTFLTTFDFEALGKGIGDAISSLFHNINWSLIGETFANRWNALINFIYGLVTSIKWDEVGNGIADFVNAWVKALDLDKAVKAVGVFINGVFKALENFIDKTKWGDMATKLANSINGLFSSIDWKGAGRTIVKGFNSVVTFLSTAIKETDWYAIGKDIVDFIVEGVKTIDWGELGRLLSNAVMAILDLLLALISETDWGALISGIITGLGTMIENIDWGQLLAKLGAAIVSLIAQIPSIIIGALEGIANLIGSLFEALGLDSIAGFFKGIGDALASVGQWLKENLVDPVVNWIKNLFGIHSPSTVFAEFGDALVQGLLNGLAAAWHLIIEFFSACFEGLATLIGNAWEAIKNTAVAIWNGISSALSGIWNAISGAATTIWNGICNTITGIWDGITRVWSGAVNFFSGIWSGIQSAFSSVAEWIGGVFSRAWDNVKRAWSSVGTFFSGIWSGIQNAFNSVAEWFRNIFSRAWQAVKDVFSTGGRIFEGIKDGIVSAFKTVVNAIIRGINKVIAFPFNTINGILDGIRGIEILGWRPFSWIGRLNVPQIPELAHGGVLKKGQVGLLEGTGAEAVVPLEQNTGWINKVAEQISRLMGNNNAPQIQWQNIVGEIVEGIHDAAQFLLNSLNGTVMQAVAEIKSAIIDSGAAGISGQLTGIAVTFRDITNLLTSIGGFSMPQIAAGTVVPAKTRVASTSDVPNAYGLSAAFTEGVDEQLDDITMLLRQIIALIKALNLNIDVDALTNAITRRQKSNARNYGGSV